MRQRLLILNHSILFLCVSMYLGTGWSMVLFSFPIAPQLTPNNYYNVFVPEVAAATAFFTRMTELMIILCIVMIIAEWRTGLRWVPIVVLLAVFAATGLTVKYIFPLNAAMTKGITDASELQATLSHWIYLNKIRVALWTVQWVAMIIYFAGKCEGKRRA